MNLLSLLNPAKLIEPLVKKVTGYIPDSKKAIKSRELKHERAQAILERQTNLAEASAGNFFVGGWRPAFMWLLFSLVVWNHIVFQFLLMLQSGEFRSLTIPPELWALLGSIGGIYGIGRSIEKYGSVKRKAEVIKVFQKEYVKQHLKDHVDEETKTLVLDQGSDKPLNGTKMEPFYKECPDCHTVYIVERGSERFFCSKCETWISV
jgi:hypothetical protein